MDVIKRHGRLADLVAVAKPDRDRNLGVNTLKSALFNTGRPVLLCPPADTAPQPEPNAPIVPQAAPSGWFPERQGEPAANV